MRLHLIGFPLAIAAVSACNEADSAPLYLDMSYQVRCIDCTGGADSPVRDIMALDQENGYSLSCFVTAEGTKQSLTLRAVYEDDKGTKRELKLSRVRLGGDPGSTCQVTVQEGANTYSTLQQGCTDDTPTGDKPCRIKLAAEGGIVKGTLLCHHITVEGDPTNIRHVVAPGKIDDPAPIEIHGCTGL